MSYFKMVESALDTRRHHLLQDLAEKGAQFAVDRLGVEQEAAIDFGNAVADFFSLQWSGQSIYISSDARYQLTKRDIEIFHKMKRGEANAIAAEYNISFVRVHQIHRHILKLVQKNAQPMLFEDQIEVPAEQLSTGKKASE